MQVLLLCSVRSVVLFLRFPSLWCRQDICLAVRVICLVAVNRAIVWETRRGHFRTSCAAWRATSTPVLSYSYSPFYVGVLRQTTYEMLCGASTFVQLLALGSNGCFPNWSLWFLHYSPLDIVESESPYCSDLESFFSFATGLAAANQLFAAVDSDKFAVNMLINIINDRQHLTSTSQLALEWTGALSILDMHTTVHQ